MRRKRAKGNLIASIFEHYKVYDDLNEDVDCKSEGKILRVKTCLGLNFAPAKGIAVSRKI